MAQVIANMRREKITLGRLSIVVLVTHDSSLRSVQLGDMPTGDMPTKKKHES